MESWKKKLPTADSLQFCFQCKEFIDIKATPKYWITVSVIDFPFSPHSEPSRPCKYYQNEKAGEPLRQWRLTAKAKLGRSLIFWNKTFYVYYKSLRKNNLEFFTYKTGTEPKNVGIGNKPIIPTIKSIITFYVILIFLSCPWFPHLSLIKFRFISVIFMGVANLAVTVHISKVKNKNLLNNNLHGLLLKTKSSSSPTKDIEFTQTRIFGFLEDLE